MDAKYCPKCELEKPLSGWAKNKRRRDGLQSYCRDCFNAMSRQRYKDNPNKYSVTRKKYVESHKEETAQRMRKSKLTKQHSLSLDEYKQLLSKQAGVCAVCGKPEKIKHPKGTRWSLAVDHNHNTGEIRGLLCKNCNTAIGLLNVDSFGILNLQAAIRYLQKGAV